MANNNIISAVPAPDDLIQFADSHSVDLHSGNYTLEVQFSIDITEGENISSSRWPAIRKFSVQGERFQLVPSAIRAVFPPAGNHGDYQYTIPHIVLERSTLPWERSADSNALSDAPWLALLVFHPNDPPPQVQTCKWSELRDASGLKEELSEQNAEQVKYIELSQDLARTLLPATLDELKFLSHVRRRLVPVKNDWGRIIDYPTLAAAEEDIRRFLSNAIKASLDSDNLPPSYIEGWLWKSPESNDAYEILKLEGGNYHCFHIAHEAATILASRLPETEVSREPEQPGARNQVHLVSLEHLYKGDEGLLPGNTGPVKLVSLYHWDFYSKATSRQPLTGLLNHLNKDENNNEYPTAWRLPLENAGKVPEVDAAIRGGWVPLRHRFRQGSRSISWYHGPIVPREPDTGALATVWGKGDDVIDIRHADELLIYDTGTGMYDVSYAAAWELGRLLTLENTKIALQLLHWKRQHAHELHAVRHLADYGYHLPVSSKANQTDAADSARESAIWQWLDELTILKHVPFNYLVPDTGLIPLESIHFFTIDRRWVECLRDGAFSIGRFLTRDVEHDNNLASTGPAVDRLPAESGFLLRSEVVSGWPDLQITAYNKREAPENGKLPDPASDDVIIPLRKERLAPNLLFVLYPGEIKSVDFFLPPETLHFGVEDTDSLLKMPEGQRIIDISALTAGLPDVGSHASKLAKELVAQTPHIRFIRPAT